EAQLQPDLPVGDAAVLDMAAGLGDLEPAQVAQRLARVGDGVADRRLYAVRRGSHQFDDLVGVGVHGPTLRPADGPSAFTERYCAASVSDGKARHRQGVEIP